jgi:hypothetical protein
MPFTGLDMCSPVWVLQKAELAEDLLVAQTPARMTISSQPVFPVLNARLRLTNNVTRIEYEGGEDSWIEDLLAGYVQEFRRQAGEIQAFPLGIALPNGVAPPVRRLLPKLLGFSRERLNRYVAVEAAAAASVSLLGTGRIALPAEVLFCLDVAPGVELTAVRMSLGGSELRLELLASVECEWSSPLPRLVEELAEWKRIFAWQPGAGLQVWSTAAAAATAQRVAEGFGMPPAAVQQLDATALADGAARFIACRLNYAAHALRLDCRSIHIDRVCSRPLGVVGHNGSGQLFWRLLFSAGTPLVKDRPAESRIVVDRAIDPPVLMLAECEVPLRQPPRWLSQADWEEHPLRVFTSKNVQYLGQDRPTSLDISLRNQFGPLLWNRNVVSAVCR